MTSPTAAEANAVLGDGEVGVESFKGQMAARYRERLSMGYVIGEEVPQELPVTPSNENLGTSPKPCPRTDSNRPFRSSSLSPIASSRPSPSPISGKFRTMLHNQGARSNRPLMKELITKFERRNSNLSNARELSSSLDCDDGRIAREAWHSAGGSRASLDLDPEALTSSSSEMCGSNSGSGAPSPQTKLAKASLANISLTSGDTGHASPKDVLTPGDSFSNVGAIKGEKDTTMNSKQSSLKIINLQEQLKRIHEETLSVVGMTSGVDSTSDATKDRNQQNETPSIVRTNLRALSQKYNKYKVHTKNWGSSTPSNISATSWKFQSFQKDHQDKSKCEAARLPPLGPDKDLGRRSNSPPRANFGSSPPSYTQTRKEKRLNNRHSGSDTGKEARKSSAMERFAKFLQRANSPLGEIVVPRKTPPNANRAQASANKSRSSTTRADNPTKPLVKRSYIKPRSASSQSSDRNILPAKRVGRFQKRIDQDAEQKKQPTGKYLTTVSEPNKATEEHAPEMPPEPLPELPVENEYSPRPPVLPKASESSAPQTDQPPTDLPPPSEPHATVQESPIVAKQQETNDPLRSSEKSNTDVFSQPTSLAKKAKSDEQMAASKPVPRTTITSSVFIKRQVINRKELIEKTNKPALTADTKTQTSKPSADIPKLYSPKSNESKITEAQGTLLSKDQLADNDLVPEHLRTDNSSSSEEISPLISFEDKVMKLKAKRMLKMFQGPPGKNSCYTFPSANPSATGLNRQPFPQGSATDATKLFQQPVAPISPPLSVREQDTWYVSASSAGTAKVDPGVCIDTLTVKPKRFKGCSYVHMGSGEQEENMSYQMRQRLCWPQQTPPGSNSICSTKDSVPFFDFDSDKKPPSSPDSAASVCMEFPSARHFGTVEDAHEDMEGEGFKPLDNSPERKRPRLEKRLRRHARKQKLEELINAQSFKESGSGSNVTQKSDRDVSKDNSKAKVKVKGAVAAKVKGRSKGKVVGNDGDKLKTTDQVKERDKEKEMSMTSDSFQSSASQLKKESHPTKETRPKRVLRKHKSMERRKGSPKEQPHNVSSHDRPSIKQRSMSYDAAFRGWRPRSLKMTHKVRPVNALSGDPTERCPFRSQIPLMVIDNRWSRRPRANVLARYRRWQEDLTTSRLPMSKAFRGTVALAASEEKAIHTWDTTFHGPHTTHHTGPKDRLSNHGQLDFMDFPTRVRTLKLGPLRFPHVLYLTLALACLLCGHFSSLLYSCGGEEFEYFCEQDDVICLTEFSTVK